MEQEKRGGRRNGAGRKPTGVEKETVSIFVEKGKIYKFGTKEKLKKELYGFIENFGVQDLTKPTNEIKPFEQPKSNYTLHNPMPQALKAALVPKSYLQYLNEKRELLTEEQYSVWLQEVDNDPLLSTKQKNSLKIT